MYKGLVTNDVLSKFIQGMDKSLELSFSDDIVQFNVG